VTFFLLFGGEPPSDDVLSAAQVEVLQPPLDPEFEATFIQTYRDSKTYLLRGLT
jgi:hypothetical protein